VKIKEKKMEENKKIIVFFDSVNRTIIGKTSSVVETEDKLVVTNPAIMSITFNAEGKMSLQLIPVMFRELLVNKNFNVEITYNKSQISISNIIELEPSIIAQYDRIFDAIEA
jgi:hypothetical protein